MKLDLSALKYLTPDDVRVLTAIELGMRNHEIVPVSLIDSIAKLKKGSSFRVMQNLLKHKLVEHSNTKYDGYILNFLGYDYLAIHTLMKRGVLVKIGPKLGVGKESDVFICYVNPNAGVDTEVSEERLYQLRQELFLNDEDEEEDEDLDNSEENVIYKDEDKEEFEETISTNKKAVNNLEQKEEASQESINEEITSKKINKLEAEQGKEFIYELYTKFEEELNILGVSCHIAVIKLARLGRTSFRAVKSKRDYAKHKTHYNWQYLSRISATNEFKFLKGLYQVGFPVPKPYDHNRHAILMQYIPSYPLSRVDDLGDKEKAYNELTSIIIKIAEKGLIHGDFNEFNILVNLKDQRMVVIDFPQMISVEHEEAESYFNRDVECINRFFIKKFGVTFEHNKDLLLKNIQRQDYLDVKLKAYGYETVLNRLKREQHKNKKEIECINDIESENKGEEEEEISESGMHLNDDDVEDVEEENKEQNFDEIEKIENEENFDVDDELELEHLKLKDNINTKNIVKTVKIDVKEKVKKILAKTNNNNSKSKSSNRFKMKKKQGKIEI